MIFEVIVVDNGSSDDSVAMVKRNWPQVRLIANAQNCGFAAANNQAFADARGRYILLLNNDTLLLPDTLNQSIRFLENHTSIGALGCRVEFPDRSFQTSCYRFNNLLELFMVRCLPLGSICREQLNISRYWGRQFNKPTDVDSIAGCFLIVRREVVASVGGLDEDFFMYGEDEEWCSRIKRAGWRIVYFPGATIIHFHRFSARRARQALRVVECFSPILVLHKRRGHMIAWCGNLILLFGLCLRLPIMLLIDCYHALKGTAAPGLALSRWVGLVFHLKGILRPIWLPGRIKPIGSYDQRSTPAPLL